MVGAPSAARWSVIALLVLAGLLGPAAPAAAEPLDQICKQVPAPVRPDFQTAGLVMDKPDLAEVPDASPDPFKDPNVPISDVYGWAWRYTNYDLGCGADFIRDPNAVASTNIANIAMAGLATMTSAVNSVENMSRSASFDFLKPVVGSIADTLDERVLTVWLPLALLVVSVIVGLRRDQRLLRRDVPPAARGAGLCRARRGRAGVSGPGGERDG